MHVVLHEEKAFIARHWAFRNAMSPMSTTQEGLVRGETDAGIRPDRFGSRLALLLHNHSQLAGPKNVGQFHFESEGDFVMARIEFPQLPQFAGMFTRLGHHNDHNWVPLPWKGIYNKALMFDRCSGLTLELAKIERGAVFPEHYHTTVQT